MPGITTCHPNLLFSNKVAVDINRKEGKYAMSKVFGSAGERQDAYRIGG